MLHHSLLSCMLLIISQICFVKSGLLDFHKRQVTATIRTTCGYQDGVSSLSRTAESNYHCGIDSTLALWGFCPNTVREDNAVNCGLVARCTDSYSCVAGCGRSFPTDRALPYSAVMCDGLQICSSDILSLNDQQYTYIACGDTAGVTYYGLPTSISATTKPTSISKSTSTGSSQSSTSSTAPTVSSTSYYLSNSSISSVTTATSLVTETTTAGTGTLVGAIVGAVLGAIALICLTVLAIFFLRKKKIQQYDHQRVQPIGHNDQHQPVETKKEASEYYRSNQNFQSPYPVEIDGMQHDRMPVELDVSSPR